MRVFTKRQPQSTNRVTQVFGDSPTFYGQYGFKWHEGLDINDTPWTPTPVYAVEPWVIQVNPSDGAYWRRIDLIEQILWVKFSYCHLSKYVVKSGQNVLAWDLIGYTWNTGSQGMAIHLHIMVAAINSNVEVINKDNGYNGSLYCWVDEDGRFYYDSPIDNKYKGIDIIRAGFQASRPLRLGSYSQTKDKMYLFDRAYTHKTPFEFFQLLEHEWSHRVYRKEFSVAEVQAWERVSRWEEMAQIKKKYSLTYTWNMYISPWETKESEDFAETFEDIVRNPDIEYWDYRDIKRKVVKWLMARHSYDY